MGQADLGNPSECRQDRGAVANQTAEAPWVSKTTPRRGVTMPAAYRGYAACLFAFLGLIGIM